MDHLQMRARALMVISLGIARHHILEGNRESAEPFDQALSLTFYSPSNKKCSGQMSDSSAEMSLILPSPCTGSLETAAASLVA